MLAMIIISFFIVMGFCAALMIGQFFGRQPITPKCNPETCCMQDEDCKGGTAVQPGSH